jgi:hypothetical protein
MAGLSLDMAAMGLGNKVKFNGSTDQNVFDFTEFWRHQAVASAGNLKQPLDAAQLAARMLTTVPQATPAHEVIRGIRKATASWVQWAEAGRFLIFTPTQAVWEAALGSNANSQAHRAMVTRELERQFRSTIDEADLQQLSATHAVGLPMARAAGTPGPALRTVKAIINADGDKVSPHLYAFQYILAIIELRYGQATQQQENAFKQLRQGAHALDSYAVQIRQGANRLRHRAEYDEQYLTTLFIEGLNNRDCTQYLHTMFAFHAPGTYTLDTVVEIAQQWERHQQKRMQVTNESAAAARWDESVKGGKAPTSLNLLPQGGVTGGSSSGGAQTYAQLKRQTMQAAKAQYGPSHPDAPCRLQGHSRHSNAECDQQKRDAPAQQHQQPAAAVHYDVSPQDVRYSPASPSYHSSSSHRSHGDYAPAAAMQPAGGGKQLRFADPLRAADTRYPQQQQQQQQQLPRPPGLQQQTQSAACGICGWQGGHRNGHCYYDRPDTAPADWRPSIKASQQLLQHYREQCRRTGRQPKEPHPPAAAPQQGIQRPAGALTDWEQQWEEPNPAQDATGEPQSWFAVGSLAEHLEPAAVATRGRQPHSFMPADNTQPRVKPAAAADRAAPSVPVPLQLSFTANVDPWRLEQILSQLWLQDSPAQAASSLAPAEPPKDPAGALQQQSVMESRVLEQLSFPDAAADPEEVQVLLDRHAENTQAQHLHLFSSSAPGSGVTMQWGPKGAERHIQPAKAASDSGCVPSIISEALVKATGLAVRELTQQEKEKVRAIDGTVSSRIYGRTEPITITLCKGTAHEVSLTSQRGFLAVRGVDASHMYDMVIGRDLLDQVSGFVVPLVNRFCYMPRMQHGDLSLHSMPVVSGRPAAARSSPMQAAGLADALSYLPACALTLQDDGPAPASEPQQEEPAAQPQPQHSTADAVAKKHGRSKRRKHRKRRKHSKTEAAAVETPPVEPAVPTTLASKAWGVVSSTTYVLLLLFLWPVLWVAVRVADRLELALLAVYRAAMQPMPRRSITYWRLGRGHRSAEGETIYLRTDEHSSGRKPRAVDIQVVQVTVRWLAKTVTAKLLLMLLLTSAVGVTGTQAMVTYQAVTAGSTSIALGQQLVSPMSYSVAHLLAAGLTDHLGHTGKCFRT